MKAAQRSKLKCLKTVNALLKDSLKRCVICPRKCGVDRTKGKTGYCRSGLKPAVYSYSPHHGEEPPISGQRGSGTIFFSRCNMKCLYCQNYYFSQLDKGVEVEIEKLAEMMLSLENQRCHNINLVTPTHFLPQILSALEIALDRGLKIPIVYNTSGYELLETVKLLDGIIDIYLPDMRYADNETARRYSDAANYAEYNRRSVKEMWRQVGDLELDGAGIAIRGLIIRLLVLPLGLSGTKETLSFIKKDISVNSYLSIMSQYYPTFKAYGYAEISRGITHREYLNIVDEAKILGLNNSWVQEVPRQTDTKFYGTNIEPQT